MFNTARKYTLKKCINKMENLRFHNYTEDKNRTVLKRKNTNNKHIGYKNS